MNRKIKNRIKAILQKIGTLNLSEKQKISEAHIGLVAGILD